MHARSTEARSVDCKLRSQSFVGWLAFNKADRLDLSCPLIRPAPVHQASGGGLGYGGQNNIWKYKKKSSPDKRRVFYTLDLRHLFASSAERYILYPLTAAAPGAAAGTHGMAHTTTTTKNTLICHRDRRTWCEHTTPTARTMARTFVLSTRWYARPDSLAANTLSLSLSPVAIKSINQMCSTNENTAMAACGLVVSGILTRRHSRRAPVVPHSVARLPGYHGTCQA